MPNETSRAHRLTDGAFAVYQLKEEEKDDFNQIRSALYIAFATDGSLTDEHFTGRHICPG